MSERSRSVVLRFAAVMAAFTLLLPALPVGAQPSLDELRERTEEAERGFEATQQEMEAAERELERLEADFSLAVEEYNEASESLAAAEVQQQRLADEVDDLTDAVATRRDQVGGLVRAMYMQGGALATYDALLGAEGIGQSAARYGYLRSAQRSQSSLLEGYAAQRTVLESRAEELAAVTARRAELTAELAARRAALEDELDDRGAEMAALEETISQRRATLASARGAETAAERRIAEQRAREEQRRQAELDAQRQQQASRQEVASVARSAPAPAPPPPEPKPVTSTSGASAAAQAAVRAALSQVGVRYLWGGSSPSTGFDCSGLTSWAYRQAGVTIPRTSRSQYAALPKVSRSELLPGDLMFFNSPISHVGMYIGNGMMVDAPYSGKDVRVRSIERGGYVGAARPAG